MKNLPDKVSKYLVKYSYPNWELETDDREKINAAVIVPAISEFERLKCLLNFLSENDNGFFRSTIIIFVINNLTSSNLEVKKNNFNSLSFLRELIGQIKHTGEDPLFEKIMKSQLRIALADASTVEKELPEKHGGVGLARKIGMDLAIKHFDYSVQSKKLLISIDADCKVDKTFITKINQTFNENDLSAAVVNYRHTFEDCETAAAIICYEIFLRYYVLGLKFANSPFAFHSIGSTIVCDHESYIKIGGMNKRKAAEDFYFLEKLSKQFEIRKITSTNVYPSSRQSWRVPFGTGQRVNRFLSGKRNEYLLHDPKSFFVLRNWLDIFNANSILTAKQYLKEAKRINNHLYDFLLLNNFAASWENILSNSKTGEQIQKQKVNWFDGFKTLKVIHYLRDNSFPLIDMFEALDEMLNNFNLSLNLKRKDNIIPDIEDQKLYLETLRSLT